METETLPAAKPDLTPDQLDYKLFAVVKYVACDLYSKNKCYIKWETDKVFLELAKTGLREEKVLLECLMDRVNKHNGTIDTAKTKITNLRKEGWFRSALFKGIGLDIDKCKKLTKQFQHFESWEISRVYFESDYQPKVYKNN